MNMLKQIMFCLKKVHKFYKVLGNSEKEDELVMVNKSIQIDNSIQIN